LQIINQQLFADKNDLSAHDYNSLNKSFSRILSKSLSIYVLISSTCPYQYFQNLYRQYFTELRTENNALIYLQIFQNLQNNRDGNIDYTLIEITHLFLQLDQNENDLMAGHFINHTEFDDNSWQQLLIEVDEDLTVKPHKALARMDVLRFLARSNKISVSKPLASRLLQNYLSLHKWIPATLFLNRDIIDQLGKSADYDLQTEAEKRYLLAGKYTRHSIQNLYLTHPDKYKGENNGVLQQLLLGSFLGVN
jgi:hypothetical protein